MFIHHQRLLTILISSKYNKYNRLFKSLNEKSYILSLSNIKPFSTTTNTSKLAIGGSKLGQSHPNVYADVIKTSLSHGINTFESGLYGDESLSNAVRTVLEENDFKNHEINLTARFGYRTSTFTTDNTDEIIDETKFSNDIIVQESRQQSQASDDDTKDKIKVERVYHNISEEYIYNHCLQNHPISTLLTQHENINFIYMVHNPEEQRQDRLKTEETKKESIKSKLVETFTALEKSVLERNITSYGVVSNGLSLDKSQYIHLDWRDVIDASCHAAADVHGGRPNLSIIQLPINLLEKNGLNVAQQIYSYLGNDDNKDVKLPTNLELYASRPLTYFQDGGIGTTTTPIKFVDYLIQKSSSSEETISTHLLPSLPIYYQSTLNTTLQYFDATHILEKQQEHGPSSLSVEERETLDGCRFLQSMIHDLDKKLGSDDFYSFADYEEELYSKVIPLIYNTFDGLDDDSASVLQNFFMVHGAAVRHTIAHNTRRLLTVPSSKNKIVYDIPQEISLQHFALQWLLKQKYISKVVVGCPKPEHVLDAVQAANSL